MANRRFLFTLTRNLTPSLSPPPPFPHHLPPLSFTSTPPNPLPTLPKTLPPKQPPFNYSLLSRHFSTSHNSTDDDEDDDEDDDDDDDGECESEEEEYRPRGYKSPEQIEEEADHIGYKVVGPVQESEVAQIPYEPVFAVVKVGNQQFKVSNDDTIHIEKLKYCDVNDKLVLNKVLMLGSRTQTIIGRPILPNAYVHAVVEEHALDAKVIIFKKKRRKNYRRKNGHRQELTRLRIIDIQGIEKPEIPEPIKMVESESEKLEKVAVAA